MRHIGERRKETGLPSIKKRKTRRTNISSGETYRDETVSEQHVTERQEAN